MNKQPEFSFFVNCDLLKETEKTFKIEANEAERKALAKRFNLLELELLQAKAFVSRQSGDLIHLHCQLSADIVQECIVTCKQLKKHIDSKFDRFFSPSAETYYGSESEPEGEGEAGYTSMSDDMPDPPDPLHDGGFDLGETVAEQLSLNIDPFPRSVNASFDEFTTSGDDGEAEQRINPFAVLEGLKKKL